RAAMLPFLAGVAVAVGVSIAGYVVLHSRGGGLLWWGGYFVTFGLWRAAWARYSATAGGRPMPGPARALMIGGVVVSVAAAAVFAYSYISDKTAPPVATGVGSCWAEEGDNVVAVPCGDADARYTATAEVSSDSECPGTSAGSIDSDQPGKVLCLAQR
ncbi:MAG TPA: hypothetical protein VFL59_09250, partial [Candidatus Nanopelagicales bacterium]|nr:hypothetical protein [Candidatus Nanopelagicales bacterium]